MKNKSSKTQKVTRFRQVLRILSHILNFKVVTDSDSTLFYGSISHDDTRHIIFGNVTTSELNSILSVVIPSTEDSSTTSSDNSASSEAETKEV